MKCARLLQYFDDLLCLRPHAEMQPSIVYTRLLFVTTTDHCHCRLTGAGVVFDATENKIRLDGSEAQIGTSHTACHYTPPNPSPSSKYVQCSQSLFCLCSCQNLIQNRLWYILFAIQMCNSVALLAFICTLMDFNSEVNAKQRQHSSKSRHSWHSRVCIVHNIRSCGNRPISWRSDSFVPEGEHPKHNSVWKGSFYCSKYGTI